MVIEMVGYNMGSIEVIIEFNQVGGYKTMCQFDPICIFDMFRTGKIAKLEMFIP